MGCHKLDGRLLLGFTILALLIRLFTYFPSVIDGDESTYLLIAKGMLDGQIPFVDAVDIKPVGIYLVFAFVLKLFGDSIFMIRVSAAVVIAATAFFLSRSFYRLMGNSLLAIAAGLLYIIGASLHKWGWAANTEIYFSFTTALGLYLLLGARNPVQFFLYGLVMGFGFIIKYHVLMDYAAIVMVFLFFPWSEMKVSKRMKMVVISSAGMALPFLICHLVYLAMGHWEALYAASIKIPMRYAEPTGILKQLEFAGGFYGVFLPVSLMYFASFTYLLRRYGIRDTRPAFFVLWFAFAWAGILMTGKSFPHYYFQALLPLVFFTPVVFMSDKKIFTQLKEVVFKHYRVLLPGIFVIVVAAQGVKLYKEDIPEKIANVLMEKLQEDDEVFIEYRNVLYFLLDKKPLTKYIHSSILIYPALARAYGVNPKKEMARIMRSEPRFCVLERHPHPLLDSTLRAEYYLADVFNGKVYIWEKRHLSNKKH